MPISGSSKERARDSSRTHMLISTPNGKRAGAVLTVAVIQSCISLLVLAGAFGARGQGQQTLARTITISSDPPGASIWTKEGRTYTCTNQLTPASIELKFHGQNDVKQVIVRKFGYSGRTLSLDSAHDEAAIELSRWEDLFFNPPEDASPLVRRLDAKLRKELETTFIAGKDAFPCTPYEFVAISVVDSGERQQLELALLLDLGPSATARSLIAASNGRDDTERHASIGRVVLDGGIAEIFARFRSVVAKFPEIKGVFLACNFSASEAYLDTVRTPTVTTRYSTHGDYDIVLGQNVLVYETKQIFGSREVTVVKDQNVTRTLTIAVPLSSIPAAGNVKDVTDAVLANGTIRLYGGGK